MITIPYLSAGLSLFTVRDPREALAPHLLPVKELPAGRLGKKTKPARKVRFRKRPARRRP